MAGDPTSEPKVTFRLGALTSAVASRTPRHTDASPSLVARTGLTRYYLLLADELRTVTLTPEEARFCCDVVGPPPSPDGAHRSPADVVLTVLDATRQHALTHDRHVDGPALSRKIVGWTSAQRYAVVDAIERWWCLAPTALDTNATLADVGLLKPERRPDEGTAAEPPPGG